MTLPSADVITRARQIKLILLDVDGVLTPGTVAIASTGGETKSFFIRDGLALLWARREGLEVGLLSGRPSEATTRRANELGLRIVVQTANKQQGYATILAQGGYADDEVAYMGDDLVDLPILSRVGLATAPGDAVDHVRQAVQWVSQHAGGQGAVRELVELILDAQGRWDALVASYRT